jgi:CDP-glucose 4,6-dehydratase
MEEYFKGKKVLITGHTGFKGSWLSLWLSNMGAELYGISISVPTEPSHFNLLNINFARDIRVNVSDFSKVNEAIISIKPDYIFHLAAQALVSVSYEDPLQTFRTNVLGTLNILESLRKINHRCIAVIITSDKAYDNLEIKRGYHENDKLGGPDPYSGSKGSAELIINSYCRSFFQHSDNILVGVGRAGNVIGGGDWASNRIIPDVIRSIKNNEILKIRSPKATRPWQHVLEPISGYLALAINLTESSENNSEAFNFGPAFNNEYTVEQVLREIQGYLTNLKWEYENNNEFKESTLLKLDCEKALNKLDWKACLDFKETINFTSSWYLEYFRNKNKITSFSQNQIQEFITKAKSKEIKWAIN